jgi:arylsulfatase A-like enzyme
MLGAMVHPLLLLLVSSSTLCPQGEVEPGAPAVDDRPNLVLLVTDDHPFDALGCAGHEVLQTPNMDRLAERGARFTHAFVTTPICAASRASIFTGRYERSHGYTFGQPPLAPELVSASYSSLLREAGYRVGFVGKFGVRVQPGARAEMFEYDAPGTYPYLPDP